MDDSYPPPRGPRALLILPAIAVALALGVAYLSRVKELATLRWLRDVPRASLASPRPSPAVYAGVVRGPDDRTNSLGQPVAADWWWVTERQGKSSRTVCFRTTRDRMQLAGDGAVVPLALFAAPTLSLFANSRGDDYGDRLAVDLGALAEHRPVMFPAVAQGCVGSNRTYFERWIPQGARAEAVACARGGVLAACDGTMAGVLSVPDLRTHRARRLRHVLDAVRVAGGILAAVLFVVTLLALGYRARALHVVGGTRPRS